MAIPDAITALHPLMREWRHRLHRQPETAYEEVHTAEFIADTLRSFGLQPVTGLAKTGVVASLTVGDGPKSIALRADMVPCTFMNATPLHIPRKYRAKCTPVGMTAIQRCYWAQRSIW